jgi:hypothetical protein
MLSVYNSAVTGAVLGAPCQRHMALRHRLWDAYDAARRARARAGAAHGREGTPSAACLPGCLVCEQCLARALVTDVDVGPA